ncbi:GspE/PulE family protein [Polynucleobacter sp. MG-6-Vaara-E2]|uniref:GspE/PulE family protein n=1 Tax=Polynucleobacter sp. MG-6-Vaara-E2 TaxID=2576932 RepID=UPI001BFCED69|nr:GspE/PulE family protein [Polynucleobacter sp. MG-6-Vaara-E2]QWD95958.1 type II/IV secretion system protein [Polynucleobacter sp. MG-6-Vaara-E2]
MSLYSDDSSAKALKALISIGKLSQAQLDNLFTSGRPAGSILDECVANGQCDEELLSAIFSKGFNLRRTNLNFDDLNEATLGLLRKSFMEVNRIIPIGMEDRFIKIAMVDPVNLKLANEIKEYSGLNPEFYVIKPSEFEDCIRTSYWKNLPEQVISPKNDDNASESEYTKNVFSNSSQSQPRSSNGGARQVRRAFKTRWNIHDKELVVEFCDQILSEAIVDGVSDIHVETFRNSARVRMRKDGAMQVMDHYSDYLFVNYGAVSARFKIMASCDISEKRLPQDGAITIKDDKNNDIDFRFSTVPTKNGERIVMRILAGDSTLSLDSIGLDSKDYQKVIDAITSPQGMILVTGPTGSGKTTTLYAALKHINSSDINILTVEDPIEYYLEGAGQVQANEKIGLTFSSILRAFLRQDPEVILVGEIRDQETIDIAIKASLTGHLLLSTLHTNDAVSTISRIVNMGVPNFMISSALTMIIAQRLVRKNCPDCIVPDKAGTADILKRVGFHEDEIGSFTPMVGVGCPSCQGTGVKGRQGIYEVLRNTHALEEAILRNDQAPQLLEVARKDGFKTLQETGRQLIQSGVLSLEEYQRSLNMDGQ